MKISRSGYYKWLEKGRPKPSEKYSIILAMIRKIERDNDENYGVRRVLRALNDEHDVRCGYGKTARIMKENGIESKRKTKYKPQTTKSNKDEKAYPNLLEQWFGELEKNRVWLADITYIRVNGAWNYLAVVMDLGRRKVVGWAIGANPTAKLACQALTMAITKENPPEELIHHSDRGCQYTSKEYRQLLEANKMIGSMSRVGNPYDNAPMESFFQSLKTEHVNKQRFYSTEQAKASLRNWIDVYYNCYRIHSALGYKSPLFYEISRNHPFRVSA